MRSGLRPPPDAAPLRRLSLTLDFTTTMESGSTFDICLDDLTGPDIAAFVDEHIAEMKDVTPPESKHALDLNELRDPSIRFWTAWSTDRLVGCGGLKSLNTNQGEIKAMRTHREFRGSGIASLLLRHIITDARKRGINVLYLETGSFPFFEPARALYRKYGFDFCEPFADYTEDPNSVFMQLRIKRK